jgi:hypothetical protein
MSRRELGAGGAFPLDSPPVVGAKEKRGGYARSAAELCAESCRASQNIWYYGVKTHVLGRKGYQTLPTMTMAEVSPANASDIRVAKETPPFVRNITVFADKAYGDKRRDEDLEKQGLRVHTPVKREKGQKYLSGADNLFSRLVSKARQAIESFFNRLNEKKPIQSASKSCSANGLIAFIFARLAVARAWCSAGESKRERPT